MGSACSTRNRTVSPTSFQTIKSKPIQYGHGSVRTDSEEIEKHQEAEMDEHSDSGQTKTVVQQNNKVIDKTNEENELKDELDDTDIDKDKDEDADGDDKDADDDEAEGEKKKKSEPLTEEELKEFKEKKYAELRSTAKEVFALESFQSEDGEYIKLIRNACVRFYNSYYALKRTTMDGIVKYRLECAKVMIDTKFVDLCCDIIIYTYTNGWYSEDGKKNELKFSPLSKCFVLLVNFTDCSDDLTIYLSNKKEFLEVQRKVLMDYKDRHFGKAEPQLKPTEDKVLSSVLSIIHNLAMRETNIEPLRSHDFVHVLQPYLESPKSMYRLNVLASLAGIINEEECEIINTNKSSVAFLLKVLGNCLKDKRRRHRGWSAKESGLTVRTLARNDANKKLLVELGALELLVELGKTGNTAEQYESVAAIWALCFDTEIRARVTGKPELGVVELLMDLKKGNDPEIKKVCNGALWTLRDDLKSKSSVVEISERKKKFTEENKKKNKDKSTFDTGGHVMVSYQWANQDMLKTIRDRLKGHGFKVWMDIDQMGGSTLQAMADAVEGADVFLMCMSNKYKNSPACRAEAEYAFQTRKKIIPLKMETGYNADGWLGFILGAKLFFDFSGKYPFEDKMGGLLKELDSALNRVHDKEGQVDSKSVSVVTATPVPHSLQISKTSSATVTKSTAKTPVAMDKLSNVRNWSAEDVTTWVKTNHLETCGLAGMTGSEIAYLSKMQTEAPEFFHKFLHDTLKARTVTAIANIGWALHDLSAVPNC